MTNAIRSALFVIVAVVVLGAAGSARAECIFLEQNSTSITTASGGWLTTTEVTWSCGGITYSVVTTNEYNSNGTPAGYGQSTYGPQGQVGWSWGPGASANPLNKPFITVNEIDNECTGCGGYNGD